jgi:hypothetical protein
MGDGSIVTVKRHAFAGLVAVISLSVAFASLARAQDVPYTIGHWEPDSTGDHRAVVRVAAAG